LLRKTATLSSSSSLNVTSQLSTNPNRTIINDYNHNNIINKIQTIVKQRRMILADLFTDYDPLRKQRVSVAQFIRALDLNNIKLTIEEYEVLLPNYIDNNYDNNMINYSQFLFDINQAFIVHDYEKQPTSSSANYQPYTVSDHYQLQFTEQEQQQLSLLIKKISQLSYCNRILYKQQFQYYDHLHHGIISKRQFQSVIVTLYSIINFSNNDLELISDYYRHGDDGINYYRFCNDINHEEQLLQQQSVNNHESSSLSSPLPQKLQSIQVQTSASLDEILSTIATYINKYRISIDDVFKDYDRLNKGIVTKEQFLRCLSVREINLHHHHQQLLLQHYHQQASNYDHLLAATTNPNVNNQYVNYQRFLSDLQQQQQQQQQ